MLEELKNAGMSFCRTRSGPECHLTKSQEKIELREKIELQEKIELRDASHAFELRIKRTTVISIYSHKRQYSQRPSIIHGVDCKKLLNSLKLVGANITSQVNTKSVDFSTI